MSDGVEVSEYGDTGRGRDEISQSFHFAILFYSSVPAYLITSVFFLTRCFARTFTMVARHRLEKV